MREAQLRDLIAGDISVLGDGLKLLEKERDYGSNRIIISHEELVRILLVNSSR